MCNPVAKSQKTVFGEIMGKMGKFLGQTQIWLIHIMTTLAVLFKISIFQGKRHVEHRYLYKSSIGSS